MRGEMAKCGVGSPRSIDLANQPCLFGPHQGLGTVVAPQLDSRARNGCERTTDFLHGVEMATKEAIEYMSRIHPLYDSMVMRVDRLPKGWLFLFECRPNGADPTWSPQRRVAYLDKGTGRMAWDMLIAD